MHYLRTHAGQGARKGMADRQDRRQGGRQKTRLQNPVCGQSDGPQTMPKHRINKTTHHPATIAFSSLNPGIGGIDCVIAVEGVSQVVFIRLNLAQRKLSVSWITPGNCAGYWKDQPGRPSEKLEGRTAPTCSRGYPGPKLCPIIASIKQRTSPARN